MLHIPFLIIKDKQAFKKRDGLLVLAGKPIDIAKKLKNEGARLIHIVDLDALNGLATNLDIYDNLTYAINVQVECAPKENLVKRLLSLKCRVVLPPEFPAFTLKEKKLLVAKIPEGYGGDARGFHDVLLEHANKNAVKRFHSLGKRVMVSEKDYAQIDISSRKLIWGVIFS